MKTFTEKYAAVRMTPARVLVALVCCSLCCFACRTETPPQPYVRSIHLEALDASCTEAWLKLTLTDSNEPRTVALRRDDSITVVSGLRLLRSDTLIVDEGLLPNRSYSYRAYRVSDSRLTDSSAEATVTTMDTSSSNFTFQIDTLGDGGGSVLYDVAIINDTLAYAVGEIYKRDSVGNWDPLPYNLVKWDGQQWELKRVRVMFRGNLITPTLYGIHAFSPTDIWLAGGLAIHGDGNSWIGHDVRAITGYDTLSFTKCWGHNSSEMYFVGLRGSLAHYRAGTWRRLESGTTQYLQDVWGIVNQQSGERTVLCAASHPLGYGEKKILSINQSNTVDTLPWPSQRVVMSVWISKPSTFYTCGGGVFRRSIDLQWKEIAGADVIATLTRRIRGAADNDVFVVGGFGVVAHYNGASFRLYPEVAAALYTSVDVKHNVVVAVGYSAGRAVIARGVRN